MIVWSSSVPPWVGALLALTVAAGLAWLFRRVARRHGRRQAWWILLPRALLCAALLLALLDPAWQRVLRLERPRTLVVLVDASTSMDVRDDGRQSRRARAEAWLADARRAAPAGVVWRTLWFDTALHETPPAEAGDRGTDIAAVLAALADNSAFAGAETVLLLTDGGDVPLRVDPPAVPVWAVGIGTDPVRWDDLAVVELHAPALVEAGAAFEVRAQLEAHAATLPRRAFADVAVRLERQVDGAFQPVAETRADVSPGAAQVTLRVAADAGGAGAYRLVCAPVPGELTLRNNERTFHVDTRKRVLQVLYHAREFGASLRAVRNELGRDSGLSFTALFRTVGGRYTLLGESQAGEEAFANGLPTDAAALRFFDVILDEGAQPGELRPGEWEALLGYVEQGGGLIWMGGAEAARAEWSATPVGVLLPWATGADGLEAGRFAVSVGRLHERHPVVAGVAEALGAGAVVDALNRVGPVKPGAAVLLQVAGTGGVRPVLALHTVGSGRVAAWSGNTLWRWAQANEPALQSAHGLLWRQLVRHVGGLGEDGGQHLSVRWDRESTRPGETAVARIRVAGVEEGLRFTASVTGEDGVERALAVTREDGASGHVLRWLPRTRGAYRLRIDLHRGAERVETWERTLRVEPELPEGARLAVNRAALRTLAESSGGRYADEGDTVALREELLRSPPARVEVRTASLVRGSPVFALLVIAGMLIEWYLRRRANLV